MKKISKHLKFLVPTLLLMFCFLLKYQSTVSAADTWGYYFGMNETLGTVWYEGAEGNLTAQTVDSWTAELTTIGWGGCWGAQVFQITGEYGNVDIKKGEDYTLKCTLKSSNCDKWVYIKIAKGDEKEDLAFAKWVFIKKGGSVTVDETFTANSDADSIFFGFGGDYGDRQGSDDDAELRYSYVPGGLTALTDEKKDGGGDPTVATKVSCSGFYLGPIIKPAKTSVKKIKRTAKKAKITLKKIDTVQGYQIKYSTNVNFKAKKTKTKTTKKNTCTVKKLKKNTKYYVRARTYSIISGRKVYSKWSKIKIIPKK